VRGGEPIISFKSPLSKDMTKMRTAKEIRERLRKLEEQRFNERPYSELKTIAWHAAKQALE